MYEQFPSCYSPLTALWQCFGRAIEVNPEEGHGKYMYMGQLMSGLDAIQCFRKGVELMEKAMQATATLQVR